MVEFNPFLRIRTAEPKVEKHLPETLKPFAPKVTKSIVTFEGYILDWDYVDKTLVLLYNNGTRVSYHNVSRKEIWKILEDEARRFFNAGY